MLKQLNMKNIILVESATIDFSEGFNVLSGETGSGKSAIMAAIGLIIGGRADTGMIRKGVEKGIVEAIFDIKGISAIETLLEQGGIDCDEIDELYIRREISANGKSRAFINNQLAQLSLIRTLCSHLISLVAQHANQDLLTLERHRVILDLFGDLQEEVSLFSYHWEEEINLHNEIETLIHNEAQRLREIEVCQMILEELVEANLKRGEDEELFHEYTLLAHAEELSVKVQDIYRMLSAEKTSVLSSLQRHKNAFEALTEIDSSLAPLYQSFQNALLELQEVSNTLNIYQSRIEYNPQRLLDINERLTLMTRLKKKYGSTLDEILTFAEDNKKKLQELQNVDCKIEQLQEKLKGIKARNNWQAVQLTQRRIQTAENLAIALKKELRSLNMPNVDFQIEITPQKRGGFGDDRIEFFLMPNIGEQRIAIKDFASGGELSRVMLALQTILSGKEQIATIVFDEIDANIGGETAKDVGNKLKTIGKKQQVLCITHFPQVAEYADHHFQISKRIVDNRTITFIHALDESTRKNELARMAGKKKI